MDAGYPIGFIGLGTMGEAMALSLVKAFFLCDLVANLAVLKTVSELNARLPESEKLSMWWWTFGKYERLWKQHKRLCPESRWRFYSIGWLMLTAICMFLLAFYSGPTVP